MTKRIGYTELICNICGDKFYTKGNAQSKHISCVKEKEQLEDEAMKQEYVHEYSIKYPGYGSFLDACKCTIHICDDCLKELFDSFKVEPKIKCCL